jgi:hypothetical protein
MAEPALNALGDCAKHDQRLVQEIHVDVSVAAGVSTGIMLGVTKLVFNYNLLYILALATSSQWFLTLCLRKNS